MASPILDSTLRSLVRRHGLGNVLKSLGVIASTDSESLSIEKSVDDRSLAEGKGRARPRPNAQEYVSRMRLPARKMAVMFEVAERFDRKTFLPTFSDIINFCHSYGIDVPLSRTRASSIPRIFRFLAHEVPNNEIQRILDDGAFSGPSRLGPIADAIRRNGRASRAAGHTPARSRASSNNTRTSSGDSASA